MARYRIDIDKIYKFPSDIRIVEHLSHVLVIAPKYANWIVLNSQSQLDVFNFLREGHSIKEALDTPTFDSADVNYVVTQIEARRLTCKEVHSSAEDGRRMHIYMTNQCNFSCPRCYMYSGTVNDNELTTEEILKLLYDYKSLGNGTGITLSGGEPTIREDFDLIVSRAAALGLEVEILSNGSLLTPERIDKLAGCISSVQISIDGYSEESNSLIRGHGSFAKALLAVDCCVSHGIQTSVAVTPPAEVLRDHIDDYVGFAQSLSAKYKGKPFRIKFAGELLEGRDFTPSRQAKSDYLRQVQEIQHRFYGDDYDVMEFVSHLYQDVVLDNCMFGVFAIAPNGDVYPCARIADLLPTANIRTAALDQIAAQAHDAELATMITRLKPCNECELILICGGGCRIEEFPNLVKRKTFTGIDYESIPPRKCDHKIKDKFYELMIRSNKYLYKRQ